MTSDSTPHSVAEGPGETAPRARTRFLRGGFWTTLAALSAQGLGFLASVVAARMLGVSGFGELGMIQTTVAAFAVFATFGLGQTATRFIAEYRWTDKIRAGRIASLCVAFAFTAGLFVTLAMLCAAPALARGALNSPDLTEALRLASLMLITEAVAAAQLGIVAGLEGFRSLLLISAGRGIVTLTAVPLGAYLWGLPGVVLGLLAGVAVAVLIGHAVLKREMRCASVRFDWRGMGKEASILLSFSLPAALGSLVVVPVVWIVRLLLVQSPHGYVELGLFTAALRVHDAIALLGAAFGTAMLPVLVSERTAGSTQLDRLNISFSWALGILFVLPLAAFPECMGVVFGPGFASRNGSLSLVLVMISTSFVMYKQGLARVLVTEKLLWWGALSNVVWSGSLVLCAVFFVRWGAPGLAAAWAVAYGANTLLFMPLYVKKRLVPLETLISWPSLAIWAAIGLVVGTSVSGLPGILRGIALLLSYCLALAAFGRLHGVSVICWLRARVIPGGPRR